MPLIKDPYAFALLEQLLVLDPSQRLRAGTALDHDFFWTDPMPTKLTELMVKFTSSMFEYLSKGPGQSLQPARKAQHKSSTITGYQDRIF